MAEIDVSNPVALIVGFFAIMLTVFLMIVRITQAFFVGGVFGAGLLSILFGFIWFENWRK
jgi:hypothetical protein